MRILVAEDDREVAEYVKRGLEEESNYVRVEFDGAAALQTAQAEPFDAIVLDIMLPQLDGLEVTRRLRAASQATPILLLTARDQISDKVIGLKLGADDYVTKPFDTLELMARVEALLRRSPGRATHPVIQLGPLRMDVRATEVTRNGKEIPLSAREFQLLRHFMEHPGATLSRSELLQEVWGYEDGTFTRTVDVHIASLRQKLEKDPKHPELILTVPGMGYKLKV